MRARASAPALLEFKHLVKRCAHRFTIEAKLRLLNHRGKTNDARGPLHSPRASRNQVKTDFALEQLLTSKDKKPLQCNF